MNLCEWERTCLDALKSSFPALLENSWEKLELFFFEEAFPRGALPLPSHSSFPPPPSYTYHVAERSRTGEIHLRHVIEAPFMFPAVYNKHIWACKYFCFKNFIGFFFISFIIEFLFCFPTGFSLQLYLLFSYSIWTKVLWFHPSHRGFPMPHFWQVGKKMSSIFRKLNANQICGCHITLHPVGCHIFRDCTPHPRQHSGQFPKG